MGWEYKPLPYLLATTNLILHDVEVPNLVCKTLEEAEFLLENLNLKMGVLQEAGEIIDASTAFIVSQEPAASGQMIRMESPIHLTIQQLKPESCL